MSNAVPDFDYVLPRKNAKFFPNTVGPFAAKQKSKISCDDPFVSYFFYHPPWLAVSVMLFTMPKLS